MKHLLLFLYMFSWSLSYTQSVTRGPYLQVNTHESIVVRWRTDIPTSSKVNYGTALGQLNNEVFSENLVTEHIVKIEGLTPQTKYYYTIGSENEVLDGPGEKIFFRTAPLPGTELPIRVWAIGDFGKGNQGQKDVRDSYLDYVGDGNTDVWIWLGDNAYNDGTQQEYQNKVFDSTFSYMNLFKYMPFWPCPGNHDYNSVCGIPCLQNPVSHFGPYYDIFTMPTQGEAGGAPSGRPAYYSFDYGNVHFMSLNSELGSPLANSDWIGAYSSSGWNNSPMRAWIEQDLQQNTKPWVVAYWHQLPFSRGSHNSDDVWEIYMAAMRTNVVPLLESYGVDLIVCGHSHVYERSYLMNGFYGNSSSFNPEVHLVNGKSGKEDLNEEYIKYTQGDNSNKGTVYVVSGNAGSSTSNPELNHPIMYAGEGGFGSFIMEFDGNRMDGKYLRSDGTIGDYFTMIKKNEVGPSSINNANKNFSQVRIFPNPATTEITINMNVHQESDFSISLVDLTGRVHARFHNGLLTQGVNSLYYEIPQSISNGIYLLKVKQGESLKYEKIMVIR
jgi:3',5'-cyclic AMP phosphodiesterase CpdA